MVLLLQLSTACPALATPVVSVSYSHRQAAHLHVDPEIPEGCIIATFTSEQPATVVAPPAGLETLDTTHWRFIFNWDHTTDLELRFTDASSDTITIIAFPEPPIPLDPLQHQIPVLDIRTPAASLWDPATGIYVFGENDNCLQHGEEWEKSAQFFFYDNSLSPEFIEDTGLRINGGWSRRFKQKGLRFYFDDYGTSDQVEYDFFGSQPTSFRRLIVRCALSPRRCFTDVLASETYMAMGHLTSRWAPLAVYLNGEYWGFYPLRERIDEEFIEHTHDLDEDSYALIKDGEVLHGDCSSFWDFINECLEEGDFSSHEFYLHAAETIDLVSYIDWLLINIYGATTDNGSSYNSAQYRIDDQPWQYMIWDEDGLFYSENFFADFFHFLSINSQEEYDLYLPPAIFTGSASARIRWAAPFRALLQNSQFKQLFAHRYVELMDTEFSEAVLDARLAEIVVRQQPEMELHGERWDWPLDTWYEIEAGYLYSWFHARPVVLNPQFEAFREEHRAPVELVGFNGEPHSNAGIFINWHTASEENCAGFVLYRGKQPDQLTPLVSWLDDEQLVAQGDIWEDAEYAWVDESAVVGNEYYYQLAWVDDFGQEQFLNWVQHVSLVPQPILLINEFLALNNSGIMDETGTFEDWVEIFNQGPVDAQLGGYFLTDNLDQPTCWAFPDTTLAAGEFLVVWCDSDPEDGPLHTNFKLSAAGETIALLAPLNMDNVVLDVRDFGPQSADISEGRQSDGSSIWVNFAVPTPGESNHDFLAAQPVPGSLPEAIQLDSVAPNPFNPSTKISFTLSRAGPVSAGIFDLSGARVRQIWSGEYLEAGAHYLHWNGVGDGGEALSSGPYLVKIIHGQSRVTAKILLLK